MISQVANPVSVLPGNAGQSSPVADVGPQKPPSPIELPTQAVKAVENEVNIGTIKKAAEQINNLIQQFDHNLQFTVDEETGINVVRVIDTQSKEVIRQMPTPEMLAIAKALDKLQGLLIKEKA